MAALYALSLAVVTVFGLNQFWLAWKFSGHKKLIPGPVPDPGAQDQGPEPLAAVTVQIPLFNEMLVAGRVIEACARLDYPRDRLEIQVLDDSTDQTVSVAGEAVRHWRSQGVNMVHLRRTHRRGFKAGALADGLRTARGELIAMFDADFVPAPDFLRRMVPLFADPQTGFVQARWGHLNAKDSLLTRLQGFGLDAHFALEQSARTGSGYPAGFNGTAGIWRRECIEDSGGWSADTLTEDLDLSYRAQLKGWRMVYDPWLVVPAELPVEMSGFRAQQHRWTKGAVQTAVKLLPAVWKSDRPLGFRVQGVLQLTANMGYLFMLLLALLHAPISYQRTTGSGPGEVYFILLGLGLAGFAGFFGAHLIAHRELHADWPRRMLGFVPFLAASVGMALSNTVAVAEVALGRSTPFVRTPKFNTGAGGGAAWWRSTYARNHLGAVVWVEVVFLLYCLSGLAVLIGAGAWSSVPFQALFTAGGAMVVGFSVRDVRLASTARPQGLRSGQRRSEA